MAVAAFSGSRGLRAGMLRLAIVSAAFALVSVASQAAPADTSGTMGCKDGKCTCRAAEASTCIAVSEQFCGKNTMTCTTSSGGAECTCTAKARTAVPTRGIVGPRPTTAAPR